MGGAAVEVGGPPAEGPLQGGWGAGADPPAQSQTPDQVAEPPPEGE